MRRLNAKYYSRSFVNRTIFILLIPIILIMTNFLIINNYSDDYNSGNSIEINCINDNIKDVTIQEVLNFDFDPKIIEEEFNGEIWHSIEIDGCIRNTIAGQPRIPQKVVELKLPAELNNIEVRYLDQDIIYSLRIQPAPPLQIWNKNNNYDSKYQIKYIDYEIYSKDEYFPSTDFELVKVGNKIENDIKYHIYSLKLYPLRYNPVREIGIFNNKVEILLEYNEPESKISNEISTRGNRLGPSLYRYLIICDSDYVDELQPFVNWKTQKGLPAKIVTVEEIYSNPLFTGEDEPDEIRNCIQYAYKQWGTEYVLLAGDQDTVPTRHTYDEQSMYTGDNWIIPADTYYACIDEGSDWNSDSDTDWGEFGELDDIIPDIAVGRIAINNENTMADWVVQNIKYEKNPPRGDWFGNITLVSDYGFAIGDCAYQANYLYNTYLKNSYDTYSKLYDDGSGTDYISGSKIQEKINNGSAFVLYTDHAETNAWGSTITFTNAQVTSLNNDGMKPVVYVMACLSTGFDHTSMSCIGEAFTEYPEKGAIAYIGSTRVAVGNVGVGYTYEPTATGLEEDFARQLKNAQENDQSQLRVGLIHKNALEYYAIQWGSQFPDGDYNNFAQRSWLILTLLGDPDAPLWTTEPQNFHITNSSKGISEGKVELKIKVTNETDSNTGIEKALVSITGGASTYDYNYTDSSGEVKFIISDPTISEVDVTVTHPNHIPLETKAGVEDFFPPLTSIDITPSIPDGNNAWYKTKPIINLTTEPLATTYYHWNSDTDNIYTEPLTVPDGIHTFYYHSKDVKNNVESESSIVIKVDSKKPKTSYNFTPENPDGENGWYISIPNITLNSKVNLTSESNVTTYYHWDSGFNKKYSGELSASEGEHTFYYHGEDEAGNIESERSISIKVDTFNPITNISITPSEPDGNYGWYLCPPNITLKLNQTVISEVQTTFYYYWDDGSPDVYTQNITPPEGVHQLKFYAVDLAGNIETERTYQFKLDTTEPETKLTITPSDPNGDNGWYRSTPNITIETVKSKLGCGNCSNETSYYYWDHGPEREYNDSIQLNLSEGEHTLFYYSVDTAGNIETLKTEDFKFDSIPPVTTINLTPSFPDNLEGWYLSVPTIDLMVEENVSTYYNWNGGPNLTYISNESLYPDEGQQVLNFQSVDEAGNIEVKQSVTIKIDLDWPNAVLKVNKTEIYILEDIYFNASDSHDFNGIIEYFFDFDDGNISGWINNWEISHNYSRPGIYDVKLKVRDSSGKISSKRVNITITVKNIPKSSSDNNVWDFLPEDVSVFTFLTGILVLIIIIIIITIISYSRRKRRRQSRYPTRGRMYTKDRAPPPRRRRPERRIEYEEDYDEDEVEPDIDWDEDEYFDEEEYEFDDYYEEDEYWDEDEDIDLDKDGYYEDEELDWDAESDEDTDIDWDTDEDDEYYEDNNGDTYQDNRHYDQNESDYSSSKHSEYPAQPKKIKKRKLTPTWRSREYSRRKPGLLDVDDLNSNKSFKDNDEDEF
jgi:hypothetical protein